MPSLVGPVVSGLLTEHASWRWVFLGLVPFTVLGGYLVAPTLRKFCEPDERGSLADPRRILRALAVAGGVAALEQAGQHPSAPIAVLAAAGLVAMVWGLRTLLPPGTYRVQPGVAAPVALRGLLAGAFFGIEAVVPLTLQEQHGFSATAAGLPLAASGISWALGSWWQGREVAGDGLRRRIVLVRAGFACLAAAAAGMALASVPSAPGLARLSGVVRGRARRRAHHVHRRRPAAELHDGRDPRRRLRGPPAVGRDVERGDHRPGRGARRGRRPRRGERDRGIRRPGPDDVRRGDRRRLAVSSRARPARALPALAAA